MARICRSFASNASVDLQLPSPVEKLAARIEQFKPLALASGLDLQERFMLGTVWMEKLTDCLHREVMNIDKQNQDALLQVLQEGVTRHAHEANGCFFWLEHEEELKQAEDRYG